MYTKNSKIKNSNVKKVSIALALLFAIVCMAVFIVTFNAGSINTAFADQASDTNYSVVTDTDSDGDTLPYNSEEDGYYTNGDTADSDYNGYGTGDDNGSGGATRPPPVEGRLSAPQNISADISQTRVRISWSAVDGAVGFRVGIGSGYVADVGAVTYLYIYEGHDAFDVFEDTRYFTLWVIALAENPEQNSERGNIIFNELPSDSVGFFQRIRNFFIRIWDFILPNWLWFAIGAGALLLLIIVLIIVLVLRRKRKKGNTNDNDLHDLNDLRDRARAAINAAFTELSAAGNLVNASLSDPANTEVQTQAMEQITRTDVAMQLAENIVDEFITKKKEIAEAPVEEAQIEAANGTEAQAIEGEQQPVPNSAEAQLQQLQQLLED